MLPRHRCATPLDCVTVLRHDPLPVDRSRRGADLLATARCRSPSFVGIHQPDGEHGANQLDAARQAIRSEATAKERAERFLEEARAMIRDLQTKLGYERLAKDEVLETVRRPETETRAAAHAQETVAAELAAERLARRNAEEALAEALAGRQEAEQRVREVDAARAVRRPSKPSRTRRATVGPLGPTSDDGDAPGSAAEQNAHEMRGQDQDGRCADDRGGPAHHWAGTSAWTTVHGRQPGFRGRRVVETGLATEVAVAASSIPRRRPRMAQRKLLDG